MAALPLQLIETVEPTEEVGVGQLLRTSHAEHAAVYPLGGRTRIDWGLPGERPGRGLSLTGLSRVVDYPARDMTITVQSGITMAALDEVLRAERQRLPIDVPQPDRATLGGVIATNTSGPRRYGQGTIRDYVIGIRAVDGRGVTFNGGGRVVKNVAGYDFCKLLTGSLGTLGVITQVTLKVKPIPQACAHLAHDLASWDEAEMLLSALVTSSITPTAIELLAGPLWNDDPALGTASRGSIARLVVGLEGSQAEVDWMISALGDEWRALGALAPRTVLDQASQALWRRLTDLPSGGTSEAAPLVVKLSVPPSALVSLARLVRELDPEASLSCQAGSGVLRAQFARPAADLASDWVKRLQPTAITAGGSAVVLSGGGGTWTRQAVWGGTLPSSATMVAIKRQFDPHHILNPGRFIFQL